MNSFTNLYIMQIINSVIQICLLRKMPEKKHGKNNGKHRMDENVIVSRFDI